MTLATTRIHQSGGMEGDIRYKKKTPFDNNEGIGGFEKGAYDSEAVHSVDVNWTRQSSFTIFSKPDLLWKVSVDDAFIEATESAAFVVDRHNNIIISDCDGSLVGPYYGRLMSISPEGNITELFKTDMRLKSPVIGRDGSIYVTTTGAMESKGHKLYCALPNGDIKWEFVIDDPPYSKPVIDAQGNIYLHMAIKPARCIV